MILSFGACGFNYAAWRGDYYPEDMPEEWCYTYYANEFDSVFLAEDNVSELAQCWDDLDESFYLLLEDTPGMRKQLKEMDLSESPNIGYCLFDEDNLENFQKFQLHTGNATFLDETVVNTVVVRVSISDAVTNGGLKSLIEYLVKQNQVVPQMFVFFEGPSSTASTIKLAQTISDLMIKCD